MTINNIPNEIKEWIINLRIKNNKVISQDYYFDEKLFFKKIFQPLEKDLKPDINVKNALKKMYYQELKNFTMKYEDKEYLIKIYNNCNKQISHDIFGLVDKYNLQENLILIDKNDKNRFNYYKKQRKYLIEFVNKDFDSITEFFFKFFTLKKILLQKNFDIDYREEICEEELKLIESFIYSYYTSYKQNCIDFHVLKNYCEILQIRLEILEEKYNIDKEEIYSFLKSIPKENSTPEEVKKQIIFDKPERNTYILTLIQIFIYTPDKTNEQKAENQWITIFSVIIENMAKLLGTLLCIKHITICKGIPSILFPAYLCLKFGKEFLEEIEKIKILWSDESEREKIFRIQKESSYNCPTYYKIGKKIINTILSIPSIPFSYFSGNLLGLKYDSEVIGFGKNIKNDDKLKLSVNHYHKNIINSTYINMLSLWDYNFNIFVEEKIKEIENKVSINKEIIDFYKTNKELIRLLTENKIDKYKDIINSKDLMNKIKNEVRGMCLALFKTPYKMIKGIFNISDFDFNKEIDFIEEIKIYQKNEGIKKADVEIKNIIMNNYFTIKDNNLQQLQCYLSSYINGNNILKRINFIIQDEFEKINKLYDSLWDEKEKSIFGKNYFGLKRELILELKENENIEGWVDIELKENISKNT